MHTKINITICLLALSLFVAAQKKEAASITENELKAHLEFIANDMMQGRDFSTSIPGLEISAEYIKAQCLDLGLLSGADDYFQELEMLSTKPDEEQTWFLLKNKKGEEIYQTTDIFSLGGKNETHKLEGEMVFAGYGWYDQDTKYNDTEGIDIKGKVVMVMTRNLELAESGESGGTDVEMKKMQKAMMGGAKALLMVPDPMHPESDFLGSIKKYATGGTLQLKGAENKQQMPVTIIFGTRELANAVVKESGKTLAELQKEINESAKPKSFVVEQGSCEIMLGKKTEPVVGKNVVAVVEGSDPDLKNECVLFTAHYDHVGVAANGEINNGADDNGSGTVALLEIAEAFQSMKRKPRRSIVFAWVTAEEKGLIGSDYYSQHPYIPLDKTLLNINLDMVGRSAEKEPENVTNTEKSLAGPNGLYIVSGKQSSELIEMSDKVCADLGLIPSDELTKAFLSRSDYYHFYKNGIPILGLSTGLHEDYHKPSDELDKIDYNKMKRVSQYAFLIANQVANQKKRILVDNPVK
jgi:Zn-dependent M28 family amino/carboxypeptidase